MVRGPVSGVALLTVLLVVGCNGSSQPIPANASTVGQVDSGVSPRPAPGGNLRYVSPDGNDGGSGSEAAPFRTLGHALDALRAGDMLVVGGGDYAERVNLTVHPGSRKRPVTVVAAKGGHPVISGLLWLKKPTWWRIFGINVTWGPHNTAQQHMVKITDGDDWLFADAQLWDARSYAAILVTGVPHRFELRNLYVHDTHRANGTNEDHLIYLNTGRGSGKVDGCLLVGSPNGRAIKVGTADANVGQVRDLLIEDNTMIDNVGPSNVQVGFHSSNVTIRNNIMVRSARGEPNVTAFELSGKGSVVISNIGWDSTGVVEHGVSGLHDDGGNLHRDPGLSRTKGSPFVPSASYASRYGCTAAHLAPGETSWCRALHNPESPG